MSSSEGGPSNNAPAAAPAAHHTPIASQNEPAPPVTAAVDTKASHPQPQAHVESSSYAGGPAHAESSQPQPHSHGGPYVQQLESSSAQLPPPPTWGESSSYGASSYATAQPHNELSIQQPQYGEPSHAPPAHDDAQEGTVLQQNLEPDSANSDADSAFGSDGNSSSSTSLASSIMNYEYSNGRRYHGYRSGSYVLPNDDEEQDRLDLLHHIFLLMLGGKLSDVPFAKPPQRVLDVGTGTGIWAIDYADENPGADILGTDLSPIQPTWVPPNAKFYIDDAESEWIYPPEEHFDYIHVRGMSGSINDWDRLCAQAYAHIVPGGWVEFQEPEAWVSSDDDTISKATSLQQWQQLCNDAAAVFKKEIRIADSLKQRMADAGFVDVHERIVKVPIGPWPKDPAMKEIGRYQREHMAMGIEPYTFGFIGKVLGWSEQECKILIAKVINEVRDRSLHMYIRFFFVVGRKSEQAVH